MRHNITFDIDKLAKALNDAAWDERMNQSDLAYVTGVSRSTICRIMTHRKRPDVDSLMKILHYLGLDSTEFEKKEAI